MFSYHPDLSRVGDPRWFAKGWKTYAADDASVLARAIAKCATSPIVFVNGHRRGDNFIAAHWIGLDFDDPKNSLDEIAETFSRCVHVLGTTKSHRKAKGDNPPCDRFRLWLKPSESILDPLNYEATVRHYVTSYGADKQCIDTARMFWPCNKIISLSNVGLRVPIVEGQKKEYSPLNTTDEKYRNRIPPWVQSWLDGHADDGKGRNELCFRTASWLTRNGFSEDEIVSIIMTSNLPMGSQCLQEVKHAVRSGRNAALRGGVGARAASEAPNRKYQSTRGN
jgi:hypothetical protein